MDGGWGGVGGGARGLTQHPEAGGGGGAAQLVCGHAGVNAVVLRGHAHDTQGGFTRIAKKKNQLLFESLKKKKTVPQVTCRWC